MFKLVVLSALLVAAVADPDVFYSSSSYSAPVSTYLSPSSGYLPVPTVYSPLAYPHFIKKRAAQFYGSYIAPSSYIAGSSLPYVAPGAYSTPYSTLLPYAAPAHLIKKRSAPLLPASYIASPYLASAPLTTYSSAILPSAPYYSGYSTGFPFIKK